MTHGWLLQSVTNEYILIVSALVCIVVLLLTWEVIKRQVTKIVINTSNRYKDIIEINKKYQFCEDIEDYEYEIELKTKRQFDFFDYTGYLYKHMAEIEPSIQAIHENKELFRKYQQEIKKASPLADEETVSDIPYSLYHYVEERTIAQELLCPIMDVTCICYIRYTSPRGRNSYSEKKEFSYKEIEECYRGYQEEKKGEESKEYQRNKMSASLRYDILKRDGFRCVICGRTQADGVKLHIDHIVPIAKGGKTVPENLRTLCEDCNIGKRDKYDEQGLN